MSNSEDKFAEWTRREAAGYNRLPDPAPEAMDRMWESIQGSVEETVSEYGPAGYGLRAAGRGPAQPAARRPQRFYWSAGIAAALVFGIGIGRWTAPGTERLVPAPPGDTTQPPAVATSAPAAVVDHLARTVVFLASFREDARTGRLEDDVRERGRDLLTTTQILMDSPASQDPRMRALLEDLELVLAQIAQLNERRGVEEARIATEAMKQRDILPRLRTVVPQGALDESVTAAGDGN
jgi:hypothetical protein